MFGLRGFLADSPSPKSAAKFIMLSNEIFALACRAYYDEEGLIVDATNGQFAHSPLTRKECDTGYYLLWGHHQHQGLLQSKDLDKCCFFPGHALKWLRECDYFPEGYFELWDIYEKYVSVLVMKAHEEKDELGRSVRGVEGAERLNKEKDDLGRSVQGVKNAERLHEEKDELGRSVNAVRGGTAAHQEKDDLGRSVLAMELNKTLHEEKDDLGRSVHAVKAATAAHEEKDDLGRSVTAMKTVGQVWESTIDGFRSHSGGVAIHNQANGWDPAARVRIS